MHQKRLTLPYSLSDLTDLDIAMENLDSTLFPGVSSSVQVHSGFANEQTL